MLLRSPMSRCPLLLCACLLFSLTACQKAVDAAAESAYERASGEKVDIDRDGNRMRIKTEDGELNMQSGKALPLPADFPKDVYLPGRYEVNSVMDMGGTRMISVATSGKVAGLFSEAQQAMGNQGWKQTMSMQHSADTGMLSFEKAERVAVLSFNKGEGDDGVVMGVQLRDGDQ